MKTKSYTRRNFLQTAGIGAASFTIAGCIGSQVSKTPPAKRPNVVLVMTDDQGYSDLSCHGNPVLKTPNLDKLYSQSVRFTDFHVDPCCAPTRSALLTGRYSTRVGVWHTIQGRSLLRGDEVTIADVFVGNGYRTAMFGKWHLGTSYPFRPHDRGFHEALYHGGGAIGNTPDFWDNTYYDDTYFRNGKPEKCQGYCTDVWFDEAIKFIRTNKNRPFFCYLATNAPHGPLRADSKYVKPYLGKVPEHTARFNGMVANLDENMARLMKELEGLGLEENTIFIFMTDNGTCPWVGSIRTDDDGFITEGYNAGMRGGKIWVYEGGHRVPFFIRWPGGSIGGGQDINRLTAHLDILPTLIDLCKLKGPSNVKLDGVSFADLLRGDKNNWPNDRTLFVHNQRVYIPEKWKEFAVMTERWRLIGKKTGDKKQLYDIKADPGQRDDIAEKYPDVVSELSEAYEAWWDDISRSFDKDCRAVIGSDKANPVRLNSHDWHAPDRDVMWDQSHVRRGGTGNGYWPLRVARGGKYEIALYRWPKEANLPLTAPAPVGRTVDGYKNGAAQAGKALDITKARLKIADVDMTKPVSPDACAVTFQVQLEAGLTQLQSWLIEDDGTSHGAYYVYVKRLAR